MPSSALVLIARDEAHCIVRCLDSVRSLVDEMIVLDTGSTDDTARLAREAGASVYTFDWCDDFSAARNAALDHSSADWNLVLDADEWFENDTGSLQEALASPAEFLGLLPVASDFDLQGRTEVAVSSIPRLLPAGVRYAGRIHEQPVSGLPRRQVGARIHHDGYRPEPLRKKKGRNRALLLRTLEDAPNDGYLHYQLGRDYEVYREYGKAVGAYAEALARSSANDRFRHDLVVRYLHAMKHLQRYEEAMQFAEQEMPNWQQSPDFYFVLGDLLLDCATANPPQAAELLPLIEGSWLKCLEIGDRPELEGSISGRGSHLAAHNLAVVYQELGNRDRAEHYRQLAERSRAHTD